MPSYENPDYPGLRGDNGLIDVIEIGSKIHPIGKIISVKVLGALAVIESTNQVLHWKILAIDVNDERADALNELKEIQELCPGLLEESVEWFRFCKVN
jgi:inorganic pyrophosphatase